jgi:hypothetical protein
MGTAALGGAEGSGTFFKLDWRNLIALSLFPFALADRQPSGRLIFTDGPFLWSHLQRRRKRRGSFLQCVA